MDIKQRGWALGGGKDTVAVEEVVDVETQPDLRAARKLVQ
jgi:hypothetical protein